MTDEDAADPPPPFVRQAVDQYREMTAQRSDLADEVKTAQARLEQVHEGRRALGEFITSQGYGALLEPDAEKSAGTSVGEDADVADSGDQTTDGSGGEGNDPDDGNGREDPAKAPDVRWTSGPSSASKVTTREAMLRLMSNEHRAYPVAEIVKRVSEFGSDASTVTIRSYISRMSKADQITSAGHGSWVLTREGKEAAAALRNGGQPSDAQTSLGAEQ